MKIIAPLLLLLFMTACEKQPAQAGSQTQQAEAMRTGTVVETIDVETYTYMKVLSDGQEVWIATSPIWVEAGDTIAFSPGIVMTDFHSDTLDRTFDYILFVGNVELIEGGASAETNQAINPHAVADAHHMDVRQEHDGAAETPAVTALEDGQTIAEIFKNLDQLADQNVRLRARVIKVSTNIMGKNWVTLQDGTGQAPDDRLLATTLETVSVGDEVIVTATLKTDVSLGSGYDYKVLLEEAVFD